MLTTVLFRYLEMTLLGQEDVDAFKESFKNWSDEVQLQCGSGLYHLIYSSLLYSSGIDTNTGPLKGQYLT